MKWITKPSMLLALLLMVAAGIFISKTIGDRELRKYDASNFDERNTTSHGASSRSSAPNASCRHGRDIVEEGQTKALSLPSGSVGGGVKDSPERETLPTRAIASDDLILAAGGIRGATRSTQAEEHFALEKRLKSINAKDWQGQGNLLVNELRANRGFEVEFTTVEHFLRGKELYGWPEGQRNWIGDEMMTMLRQEMPAKAYELFRDIQADAAAPDAMRDYSIQHISHLIADGAVGQEGVALIRAALESNNPVLASTALVSLHRLSETSPALMKAEEVKEYAQRYENSQDQRLKISAAAILREESRDP